MVTRPDPAMDTLGEALGGRVAAFGIDALVVSTVWVAVWGTGAAVRSGLDGSLALLDGGVSAAGIVVWLLAWLVVVGFAFAYFAASQAVAGQSLGKRMADVVVVADDGGPCDRRAAAVRTGVLLAPAPVVALLSLLLGMAGAFAGAAVVVGWLVVEFAVALVDDDHRRLGDRLAGTVVVEESLGRI